MTERSKKTGRREAALEEASPIELRQTVREGLLELVARAGQEAIAAILEEDVARLCGRKYERRSEGSPMRWGEQGGAVVLGGRRVKVTRPRVRQGGREMELPSYAQFQREDPLEERAMTQMLCGVSTRKYKRSLEDAAGFEEFGTSKSAVSRRFVALSKKRLETLMSEGLADNRWVAVMIDALHFGDHTIVVALGIDDTGEKHVLGLREGSTENATLCRELVAALVERGLPQDHHLLFVIDGGKGLRKGIRDVMGEHAVVQRCQVHKQRNVLDHLPDEKCPQVRSVLTQAYRAATHDTALRRLQNLAKSLEGQHPGAAASLREGLEETLTVKRLGLSGALERTLSTTNPIENLNSSIRRISGRVRRCRGGTMALRWVGAAVLDAQKTFRRLKGKSEMHRLADALKRLDRSAQNVDVRPAA
jgi:putative transposase